MTRNEGRAAGHSRCAFSKRCGGCRMIDLPYEEQVAAKQEYVASCLESVHEVLPIIRMKNPDHYRNKATTTFGYDRRGKTVCGVYREFSHEIVPVRGCLIEQKAAERIAQTVYELMPSFKIRAYDEDRGTGLLRHVQVRTAHATREVMVTMVAASPVFPSRNNFVKELRRRHPEITTIVMNINDRPTNMVMGEREIVLYGPGHIEDELCGKRFLISSRSFYQVNSIQTEKLYNIAIDAARLSGKERIIDAYCGIGTIGIIASDRCREVIGTELNPEAVKNARENARRNGASNVRIVESDAGAFMTRLAEEKETADVLFLDPPRSGASSEFLEGAAALSPRRIVYVSCNPATLARDIGQLNKAGYQVKKLQPVDMFPYTAPEHVEVVCLLEKCVKSLAT